MMKEQQVINNQNIFIIILEGGISKDIGLIKPIGQSLSESKSVKFSDN